jgi:hypothetical protein
MRVPAIMGESTVLVLDSRDRDCDRRTAVAAMSFGPDVVEE